MKAKNEASCDERVLGVLERIATALERLALDAPLIPATRAHVEGLGLSALQTAQVAAPPVSLTEKEPPCPSRATAATTAATPASATSTSPAASSTEHGSPRSGSPSIAANKPPADPATSPAAASASDTDTKPSTLAEQCRGPVVDLGESTRDVPTTHDLWVRFPFEDKAELQDLRDCGLARPGSERPDSVTIATVKRLVCRALCPNGDDAAKLAAWRAHVAKLDAAATPGTKVSGEPAVWKLAAIVWAVPVAQLDGSAVS